MKEFNFRDLVDLYRTLFIALFSVNSNKIRNKFFFLKIKMAFSKMYVTKATIICLDIIINGP